MLADIFITHEADLPQEITPDHFLPGKRKRPDNSLPLIHWRNTAWIYHNREHAPKSWCRGAAGSATDKSGGELGGEFAYRLDFDGTWALFILTPAAWPIGRDAGGCILTRSHVLRRWPEGAGRRYIGIPKPKRISNAYVSFVRSWTSPFSLCSLPRKRRRTSFRPSLCLSTVVAGQASRRRCNTLNCECRGCDRCPFSVGMRDNG